MGVLETTGASVRRALPDARRAPQRVDMRASSAGSSGGSRGLGSDVRGRGEGEKPRRGKSKATLGIKIGGGGGTWEPIPSREVDDTLLCGAANRDRVRVKSMFALVGVPPHLRASDGLATFWAYHSQGKCSSNCDSKWDHCLSAAEDIDPRREYARRIRAKI